MTSTTRPASPGSTGAIPANDIFQGQGSLISSTSRINDLRGGKDGQEQFFAQEPISTFFFFTSLPIELSLTSSSSRPSSR
ncbi:hypothetical protein VTN00DRAFT_2938 [Thermoascus crustaceus]|uniref:uncharacterized protein n=1 Tax=Thermoascus crustaceus TaxID=5088 RepID=UPI0037421A84